MLKISRKLQVHFSLIASACSYRSQSPILNHLSLSGISGFSFSTGISSPSAQTASSIPPVPDSFWLPLFPMGTTEVKPLISRACKPSGNVDLLKPSQSDVVPGDSYNKFTELLGGAVKQGSVAPVSSFHTIKMKRTYFSFNFIVQELLFELGQRIVCAVIIEVQGVQYVPEGKKTDYVLN